MESIEKIGKCLFCESEDTVFLQDEHHKTDKHGASIGILQCNNCGMVMFWYAKTKEKMKISGNKIEMSARPVINVRPCWDGPVNSWLWGKIMESSTRTGRPLETYYTNITIKTGITGIRYFEFETG